MNLSKASEVLENPQRPYADPLFDLAEEWKIWSDPYGDVGRSTETIGPPLR